MEIHGIPRFFTRVLRQNLFIAVLFYKSSVFFALRLDSSQDHKRTSQNICIFVAAAVMLQVRFDFRLNLI